MSEPILEFEKVAAETSPRYDGAIWQVSFKLMPGELILVHLQSNHVRIPLADVAQGLVDPIQGTVRFRGKQWTEMSVPESSAQRACIGRVFDEPAWISELDMEQNVMLAQRHHSSRSDDEIRDEAWELARVFSLPGLPQGPPSTVRPADLRRAACIRAFLGKPQLLILERPTAGVYPEIMPPLMDSISVARARGSAVLWLSDDWDVCNDPGIRPTRLYSMSGTQMRLISQGK